MLTIDGTSKRNGRKGNPKVRTGCYTCKIRKVKCDEERPHCLRCTRTGRKCDGYPATPTAKKTRRALTIIHPMGSMVPVIFRWKSEHERHSFEHWHTLAAPALGGKEGDRLFSRFISQFSIREESMRAAVLALSASHEQFTLPKTSMSRQKQLENFILEQYGESINILARRMDDTTRYEVVLLACICYIALEFLQGDLRATTLHTRQGISLLTKGEGMEAVRHSKVLSTSVTKLFWRMCYLSFLFGEPIEVVSCSLHSTNQNQEIISSNLFDTTSFFQALQDFDDLTEARAALLRVVYRGMELLWLKENVTRSGLTSLEANGLLEQRRHLQECLDNWILPFNRLQMTIATTHGPGPLSQAASELHMHYLTTMIWLDASFSGEETAYDAHSASFLSITALAAPSITTGPVTVDGESQHPFGKEINLMPPLYFTAVKCRWPHVRKTAIALLKAIPEYHQTLRGRLMTKVAERLAEIEGNDLSDLVQSSIRLPAEDQRIARVGIEHLPDSDDGHSRHKVTFFRRYHDTLEEVKAQQEIFRLTRHPIFASYQQA